MPSSSTIWGASPPEVDALYTRFKPYLSLTAENVQHAIEQLKDQSLNIQDFGAIGNGEVDDTDAIQSALDSGAAQLYIPPGTYKISAQLNIRSNTRLIGSGIGSSTFVVSDLANITALVGTGRSDVMLSNFKIDCRRATQSAGNGIIFVDSEEIIIDRIKVVDAYNNGILFDDNCRDLTVSNCVVKYPGGHGIALSGDENKGQGKRAIGGNIYGNFVYSPGRSGINVSEARQIQVFGNTIRHSGGHDSGYGGVRVTNGSERITITGNTVEKMSRGVFISESFYCTATGNSVFDSHLQGFLVGGTEEIRVVCCVIANNVVLNPGNSETKSEGIRLVDTGRCVVEGNVLEDGVGNMNYGVYRSGTYNGTNVISNNTVSGPLLVAAVLSDSVEDDLSNNVSKDSQAEIASAGIITLPSTGNLFNVTGTTTINNVQGGYRGRTVTLRFANSLTVTDSNDLRLAGDFAATASSTLTLTYLPSSWYEISRSTN